MNVKKLPAGVQDILPRECKVLNSVLQKLARKFASCGFEPVMSGALEYYDTYSNITNAVPQEKMFKTTDSDGKLLVLRPDSTLAISRIAATKLEKKRARLYYFSNKWDMTSASSVKIREIFQAGVECLGEAGALSDAQTIALAIECLQEAGVKNFIVDVGHVGYLKGILQECGLDAETEEKVRAYINCKDGLNAERILRGAGVKGDALNTVLALPALFGGAEVLDRAKALTKNALALSAISHLKEVYRLLEEFGLGESICFDLGAVKSLSYYSGIVFTGLVKELGTAVFSGGRYDALADDFGAHIPAVGFAMGLKRLLVALERQGSFPKEEPLDFALSCEKGAEGRAMQEFQKRIQAGKRGILLSQYGKSALKSADAAEKLFVTEGGVEKV